MAEFSFETGDSVYSYDVSEAPANEGGTANIRFDVENNNQQSNTLGFLHKTQKGRSRVKATVVLGDTKTRIETNIFPMLVYQDSVNVTFDRNVPGHTSATIEMNFNKYTILKEFDGGNSYEIQLEFTEILTT